MKIIRKKIDEVTPDPGNVRKHSQKNIDAIKASLNRFGQQKPIVCDSKMVVRAGNGTLQAATELGWQHINVIVSDLDRADLIAYSIADNRTSEMSEWDVEGLTEQLAGLDDELADIAYADFDLDIDLDENNETSSDEMTYSQKIEPPIYEITGKQPSIDELIDSTKSQSLIKEIKESDLPNKIKNFLIASAARHNVFNFQKIAEYYAHQNEQIQNLMEKSALVIIDYKKAIENGYVQMSKNLAEAFDDNSES